MSRPRARLVALALLGLTLAACGKKGPPVVPEHRLPAAPAGLAVSIDEATIVVTATLPQTRIDGTPLKDLAEVKIHRREDSADGPLKPAMLSSGRIVGYEEVAAFRLDAPSPALAEAGMVRWVDSQRLVLGHRYVYVVTALDAQKRSSPPSERKAITFLATPKPPTDVRAVAGEGQVRLLWDAPAEFTDGSPAGGEVRFLVLRGTGEGPMSAVTPEPVPGTSYIDTGLANDTEYRYAVRGVRVDPRAVAAGLPSAVVAATPRTTTPPAPPGSLFAVAFPGVVRLEWKPSPSASVALYGVYRADAVGAFVRIGTTTAGNTTFADRTVAAGATYRYQVTAIDSAREPNESARSAETTVIVP